MVSHLSYSIISSDRLQEHCTRKVIAHLSVGPTDFTHLSVSIASALNTGRHSSSNTAATKGYIILLIVKKHKKRAYNPLHTWAHEGTQGR
jgi:hypothetical protein